jgi:uncharacterized protein YuzE
MFIEYDSDQQVVYIKIREGKIAKTIEYKDELFLDLDKRGELLGVEMLNMKDSKYLPEISKKFASPEFQKVHTKYLRQVYA